MKANHQTHHNNVRQLWEKQVPHMLAIREFGAQKFFDSCSPPVGARGSAIKFGAIRSRTLECIDCRRFAGRRRAGAGLLMDDHQFAKMVAEDGIEEIATHDECGAAAYVFRGTDPNKAVREWGAGRAEKFNLRHVHHSAGQIHQVKLGDEHLTCPHCFLPAVTIYLDGTGYFRRIATLPVGFVVDHESPHAQHELKLCVDLTLQHGFGGLFSPAIPMHIICIADNYMMLERMARKAQLATNHLSVRDSRKFASDSVLVRIPQPRTFAAMA